MSKDISSTLEGWDFDPNQISVRIVAGENGRDKIQLRLDLGLMQMEFDGRPDGHRPEGAESWLDYYEAQAAAHADGSPSDTTGRPADSTDADDSESEDSDSDDRDSADSGYQLDAQDCGRLLREGVQYYHRYVSFWHLDRYELCARDTARNLRLFAFVRKHAANERDKLQFDQFRPYVLMMHARAVATPLVNEDKFSEAIEHIETGIEHIRDFLREYNQLARADQCGELVGLEQWRDELIAQRKKQPGATLEDTVTHLQTELQSAVSEERFEEAARLRDEIRRLTGRPPAPFRPHGASSD